MFLILGHPGRGQETHILPGSQSQGGIKKIRTEKGQGNMTQEEGFRGDIHSLKTQE